MNAKEKKAIDWRVNRVLEVLSEYRETVSPYLGCEPEARDLFEAAENGLCVLLSSFSRSGDNRFEKAMQSAEQWVTWSEGERKR